MKNGCVFCSILAGEIPCFKLYEDDAVLAYLDINPFSEGHTLVIPKKHVTGLAAADDALLAEIMPRIRDIAGHVVRTLGADGFNLLQNNGEAAGQSVFHLHFHIIPRRKGEPLSFTGVKGDFAQLEKLAARLTFKSGAGEP